MLSIIAALTPNRVIGNKSDLPWYLPEDLERFKKLTINHPIILGWTTFISIMQRFHDRLGQAKPLPKRIHYVLTRKNAAQINEELKRIFPEFNLEEYKEQIVFCNAINTALELSDGKNPDKEIFIIGGAQIFASTIGYASKLYLTEVKENISGDTFFPEYDMNTWQEEFRESHEKFDFVNYIRKQ
jgi:dihydrofolate reductase